MTQTSRQQRRKIEREQTALGNRLLRAGLAAEPRREEVIAIARVIAGKLGETTNDTRASQAAGLAHDLFEASLKARPSRVEIACRDKCSYCCHQYVGVVPPEVFRLADAVRADRSRAGDVASVIARCAPLRGLSPEVRVGRKLPCPLLVDNRCSTYAQRPLVCRQTTSLDLSGCLEEFEGHNMGERMQASSAHLAHAGSAHVILLGALRSAGLPDTAFELSAALDVALSDSQCQTRWLSGEPVFGSAQTVPPPPRVDMVARQIAASIA